MSAHRGVNLGGWLVLEKWMTPSLFKDTDAIDEYTFSQSPTNHKELRHHRKTFIQEEDFVWLHDHGIDLVRIPIGYWLFGDEPPYVGAIDQLDWAFKMAKKYRINILLSLHGAPGSQNGQDHSGRVGLAAWFDDPLHRSASIRFLERIAERYGHHASLWGIQLLNEPKAGLFQWTLRRYYKQAYAALDFILPRSVCIIYHDGFTPRLLSGALPHSTRPVLMDVHWYHFPWLDRLPLSLYWRVVAWHARTLRRLSRRQPIIVGEWSAVLSGRTMRRFTTDKHLPMMLEHIRRQQAAYQQAEAWCYWSYKTQERGIWHFRSLVEDGHIKV